MRKGPKIVVGIVLAGLVVIGAGTVLSKSGIDTPINGIADSFSNSIANGIIDAADIKGKAEAALLSNANAISSATGLPAAAVEKMIDDLGIQEWTVTSLPSDAMVADTGNFAYGGETISVTSYENTDVVTLGYKGADITFEIPESAQSYVKYLGYL